MVYFKIKFGKFEFLVLILFVTIWIAFIKVLLAQIFYKILILLLKDEWTIFIIYIYIYYYLLSIFIIIY
jgi:hypothetical protein